MLSGLGGDDTLRGGEGAYTLIGGAGNDQIDGKGGFDTVAYVTSPGAVNVDLVAHTASDGFGDTDTLNNIESISGSAYDDALTGGVAANGVVLNDGPIEIFRGDAGNDTLSGGAGNDTIRCDTLLNALSNRDTITDFNVVADTIELENAIFGSLTSTGTLATGSLRAGAGGRPADADDHILYGSASGARFYNADGNVAGTAVQFATLGGGLALSNADFLVT